MTISSRFVTLSQNADLFKTSQRIQLGVSSVYLHPDFDETFIFYASGAYEKSDFTLTLYQAHQAAQIARFDCSFRNHAFMEKNRLFYAEQIEVAFVIPDDYHNTESGDA